MKIQFQQEGVIIKSKNSIIIYYRKSTAIFITKYFTFGHSGECETYGNEKPLSKESHFICKDIEVWGFDYI